MLPGNPENRGLASFLFGQSMGGAVALKVHFKQPNEWNGAVLIAPMCKVVYQCRSVGLYKLCLGTYSNSFIYR